MKLVGITAPMTGSGKTTVTVSLLSKIKNSVGIKIGPDYIDVGLLSSISGNRAWNMDRWIQGKSYTKIFQRLASRYDVGIVEGVMGLYDSGFRIDVSTMFYFKKFKIPYRLVIDISKVAESAYYIANKFLTKNSIGVILNKYGSEKHLEMVSKKFKDNGIKVLGAIPNDKELSIEERHLGLKTAGELSNLGEIANKVSRYIDFSFIDSLPEYEIKEEPEDYRESGKGNIWIAYDNAFNFYYTDTLDALEKLGKVRYFSPIRGEIPEEPDLIYIGGGYPELYSDVLSTQKDLLKFIKDYYESGGRIIAECGGLMYLEREMIVNGKRYGMTDIFHGSVKMGDRPVLGYTELLVLKDSILLKKGEIAKGHEFHYSSIDDPGYKSMKNLIGKGIDGYDGRLEKNVLGSYSHFSLATYYKRLYRNLYER
ncbi:MAG: cobyrinate a,c-diamide synthase [Thermoplasmatales archaeon]